MAYWKIVAQSDTVYVEAPDERGAKERLTAVMGEIPASLLTITEVKKLPKNEELL
jgi:hypothetical protein